MLGFDSLFMYFFLVKLVANKIMIDTSRSINSFYGFNLPSSLISIMSFLNRFKSTEDYRQIVGDYDFPCVYYSTETVRELMNSNNSCQSTQENSHSLYLGRYDKTPLELFPIFNLRMDGIHYGYVVHAPELGESDYHMAEYAPAEFTPASLIGLNTFEGFNYFLNEAKEQIRELNPSFLYKFETQILVPIQEIFETTRNSISNADKSNFSIPYNWKMMPTLDGLGVLAPNDAFTSSKIQAISEILDDVLAQIDHLVEAGYPASALILARDFYWKADFTTFLAISSGLKKIYRALGRESLVKEVDRELSYRSTSHLTYSGPPIDDSYDDEDLDRERDE
jgi:hypothetical protein